jgi:hypothetical protein
MEGAPKAILLYFPDKIFEKVRVVYHAMVAIKIPPFLKGIQVGLQFTRIFLLRGCLHFFPKVCVVMMIFFYPPL